MNTKFIVFLVFVGVVCANVGAREDVSGETKLGISISTTANTNAFGAELDRVYASTGASNSENSDASAAAGPGGPNADGSGNVYKSTYGYVDAEGPGGASASSGSSAYGSTSAGAAAGPDGAVGTGTAYGSAGSSASGDTSP